MQPSTAPHDSSATAMAEERWVVQATHTARTVVQIVYACTFLLVAALTIERFTFNTASDIAVNNVKSAIKVAAALLLEDERLTMSANLAAATGEHRWVDRYEAHIPMIDAAIKAAIDLAPPGAAQRFDQATRIANDRLVAMEREAFARVAAGNLAAAMAVLESPAYAEQKAILTQGSDTFVDELQAAVDQRREAVELRSWSLIATMIVLAVGGFVLLWRRLTAHLTQAEAAFNAKQAEVTRLALHDALTGLANRRYLHLQLEGSIARARREQTEFAVLVIDLDFFKPINDRHGHAAGDAVLMEISRRLSARVRKGEVAARLGGDEFVVVLNHGESNEVPLRAAQRLVAALAEPIALAQGEMRVGASVGVAFYPSDATEPEDLIRKADVALYRAKGEGGNAVRFFQQSMDEDVRERAELELDLRQAIASHQIVPYFQPLIDLRNGELTGFEVLARWIHPERGLIAPDIFIPIAEDTGQIDAVTVCVMRAALSTARDWDPRLTIAVNIAPQQLKSESLTANLLKVLDETRFPPSRFEIEITENALIGDIELARRIVVNLKSHGIRVALDDFGTGYSSLSHLSELPFDKIKIDRSFIRTLHTRRESATIVNAIIGLGRSLNLPTTAEGIESLADADMLTQLGCNSGQGFLYSKPVPATEAAALIAQFAQPAASAVGRRAVG